MCYQYPFAVLPVVVPAPESHRSVSIPLGTLSSPQAVYRSLPCKHESSFIPLRLLFPQNLRFCGSPVVGHGILRRGIISPPDGYSIVKVQVPLLVPTGIGGMHAPSAEQFLSDNKKTAGNARVYWDFRLKQYFEIFLEPVEKRVKICYNIKKVNS